MVRNKKTKVALFTSLLSMVMCVAMLVSTTFAWFTDTASTKVTNIVSGDLDISLEKKDKYAETWTALGADEELQWISKDTTKTEILWEPGCTYNLQSFRVVNNGNLAIKYKVIINGLTTTSTTSLLSQIDFSVKVGEGDTAETKSFADLQDLVVYPNDGVEGHTGKGDTLTIFGTMKTTADSAYEGKECKNIKITVVATQATYEQDSNNQEYDAEAVYPITKDEFVSALKSKAANVTLGGDLTMNSETTPNFDTTAERIWLSSGTKTLNLNNKTISFKATGSEENNFAAIFLNSGRAKLTVNGEGKIDAEGGYCFHLTGGKLTRPTLTINGGEYIGSPTVVNVQYGTAYINGGFFQCNNDQGDGNNRYLLNCIDANYKKGYAKIIVTGGTFVNFDPSNCRAESDPTNFVAEGYTVKSETKDNGDVWYTVVPEQA